MLFLLSCLCGNNSSASSERPSLTPRAPDTSGSPAPQSQLSRAKSAAIGQTGVSDGLYQDRQQSAPDFGESPRAESSFMDMSVVVIPEGEFSEDELSESDASSISQTAPHRKAVTFNRKAAVREFEGMRWEGGISSGDVQSAPDHVALGRDSIEAGAIACRKFMASARHWVDVLESKKSQERALSDAGAQPTTPLARARETPVPEMGVEGFLSLQALLDVIEDSSPVMTARRIFADARSQVSEGEGTADRGPIPAMEFLCEELFDLVEAMFDLKETLDYLRQEGTQHPHQKVVERLVNRIVTNEGLGEVDGVEAPHFPQAPIVSMSVVDDPKRVGDSVQAQSWVSFAGDETTVSHSLAPILIWGEFLAGLGDLAVQIAEGAAPSEVPEDTWVKVLRN
ncbi:hypothetical protein [Ottowia thiooxydans]|uniref:Uncharacterized protein n=1 Tax=Ottowia thiooxydans TaxID=219182 RepID=A0ABV2QAR5_9BURK